MKNWIIVCILLALAGIGFLLPGMKGYLYISLALFFAAFIVMIANIASDTLKRIVFSISALGLIYLFTVEALIVSEAKTDNNSGRSYVVVLGAAVKGTNPTLSLTHRLQAAEKYLKQYPDSFAVVSGGQGEGEDISEAQCMFNVLTEAGVAPDRILLEDKSTSTVENLEFSKKIILERGGTMDDTAILSSPYHLYRAKVLAKNIGYIDPAGVAGIHGYPIYSLGMYIREAFGLTHLWIFGD